MELAQRYDLALKQLFLHPEMIAALLHSFISEPWIKALDLSSLHCINPHHVTDDLRSRENDMVWKIKAQGDWLYLIFMLEFQSTQNHFMAVRLLTYAGLIYQDLLKNKQQHQIKKNLPPLFSLVFYTGEQPWRAPLTLKECFHQTVPNSLMRYQPQMEYLVLDIGQTSLTKYTIPNDSPLLSLIELEKARNVTEVKTAIINAKERLKGKVDSLKRAFYLYAARVAKLQERFSDSEVDALCEGDMLAERMERWAKELKQEGIQEGMQQGMQQGTCKGLKLAIIHTYEKLYSCKLPNHLKQQMETASSDELERLLDNILNTQLIA